MKVVIYQRVSTDKQEAENQTLQLKDWIDRQGHELVRVYEDISSGKNSASDRKGLYDLLSDLKRSRRGFDLILFYSLDRLSREGTVATIQYLELFRQYGVEFHSFMESYISSLGDFSEPIISILSTLAKIERQKISERTKAGLDRVRKSGIRLGRPSKVRMYMDDVLQLKSEGIKPREIAKRLGISVPTVYGCLKT